MDIICYACGRDEFPENTLEAIENCQTINPNWHVEMDLQLTGDGEIVLFHDENTMRTTGHDANIHDLTFAELQKLNAGYGFERGGAFPFRKDKIQVPTLLQLFQCFPKISLLLDVHAPDLKAVPLIINLIEDHKMSDQVVILSKYDATVNAFKARRPDWIYGAATKEVKKLIYSGFLRLDTLFPLKSDILMIPVKYGSMTVLTTQIVKHAKNRNKKIWARMEEGESVKSVESLSQIRELETRGADGIFTEFPGKISKELKTD